jgi:hypothetical protein
MWPLWLTSDSAIGCGCHTSLHSCSLQPSLMAGTTLMSASFLRALMDRNRLRVQTTMRWLRPCHPPDNALSADCSVSLSCSVCQCGAWTSPMHFRALLLQLSKGNVLGCVAFQSTSCGSRNSTLSHGSKSTRKHKANLLTSLLLRRFKWHDVKFVPLRQVARVHREDLDAHQSRFFVEIKSG